MNWMQLRTVLGITSLMYGVACSSPWGDTREVGEEVDPVTLDSVDKVAPPWVREVYGEKGSFDFPLVTLWDGDGWHPQGTVPDTRDTRAWLDGIAVNYNCYANEITGGPHRSGGAYSRSHLSLALDRWHAASGFRTDIYNDVNDLVTDSSHSGIQILPMVPTGRSRIGSATPECDDNGDGTSNLGQSLFALVFPPGYDTHRTTPYPVVFITPGYGSTHLELVLADAGETTETLGSLMAESVANEGRGVIYVIGNAGGQGSLGMNSEYANAVNTVMGVLEKGGNADMEAVVTWGYSRGGTNALFHASRPGRNYRVVGAFAAAPVVAPGAVSRMKMNVVSSIQGNYKTSLCFKDSDCQNAWRWDHDPAPGTEPTYINQPAFGTSDSDKADAMGPLGMVDGFDDGAFVELCVSPRDFVSGMGLGHHYYDQLPAKVSKRFNNTFGAGHGLLGPMCTDHMRQFVLDKVVGNQEFEGAFERQVQTGEFHYRLTLQDDTPFEESMDELELLEMGCGNVPPALMLPSVQQSTEGGTEPSHFVLTGTAGRAFSVELTTAPGSSQVIHQWTGILGENTKLPRSQCETMSGSDTLMCHFDDGLDECTGTSELGYQATCGWRFHYDCDGDGVAEEIPSTYTPYVPQVAPELSVSTRQCRGAAWCMSTPDPDVVIAPAPGLPVAISPCLNFGNTDCSP